MTIILALGTISKCVQARFLIIGLVFVSHEFEFHWLRNWYRGVDCWLIFSVVLFSPCTELSYCRLPLYRFTIC